MIRVEVDMGTDMRPQMFTPINIRQRVRGEVTALNLSQENQLLSEVPQGKIKKKKIDQKI